MQELERFFIRRDQAGAGAALDRHVADRHAAFHRERTDRLAGIFQHIAGAAGGADLADDRQDDVLAGDAVRQFAVDHHAHVLGLLLDQGLRRQHMLDFRGADAVRQRAERAVRGGVAVAADDGGAGQGKALLRADDVDDALALVELVVIFDAEFPGVLRHHPHLFDALRIGVGLGTVGGRDVVVDHGQRLLRRVNLAARGAQAFKRLRRGHLVDQMAVDIEQAGAVFGFVHQMVVPDLVVQRGGFGHERKLPGIVLRKQESADMREQSKYRRGPSERARKFRCRRGRKPSEEAAGQAACDRRSRSVRRYGKQGWSDLEPFYSSTTMAAVATIDR